jgi:hypothetical protein
MGLAAKDANRAVLAQGSAGLGGFGRQSWSASSMNGANCQFFGVK